MLRDFILHPIEPSIELDKINRFEKIPGIVFCHADQVPLTQPRIVGNRSSKRYRENPEISIRIYLIQTL